MALRSGTDRPQRTRVTLAYDRSAVPTTLREHIEFPPFPRSHVENSRANLEKPAIG